MCISHAHESFPTFSRTTISVLEVYNCMDIATSYIAMADQRDYDIVVFGSTGYTGQFVAEELKRLQGEGRRSFKWAAAGRKENKVRECLRGKCRAIPIFFCSLLCNLCGSYEV